MELTSRELATIIILVAFAVLAVVLSRDRTQLREAAIEVLKALSAWKVWSVILAYLLYATGVIVLACLAGLWSADLMKDTLIIVFFVGLPIIANASKFEAGTDVFAHVVKEVLGVTAILVVYLNLAPFPLWGELILQVVLLFAILIAATGKSDPENAPVVKLANAIVALIGIGLIIHVTVRVAVAFDTFDWNAEARAFALSVLLPLSLIPFTYGLGLLMSCEATFVRLKYHNNRGELPLRVRLALLLGFHGSLRYATGFTGLWLPRIATQTSFTSARRTMRAYRLTMRENARKNRDRERRLRENAGVAGVDEDGLWRDRREFYETKRVLEGVFYSQMRLYRYRGARYWTDPVLLFPVEGFKELPEDHGVQLCVRDDAQEWFAWRRTIGGFYLGVGGTSDVDAEWRYTSAEPPDTYPADQAAGWKLLMRNGEGYLRGDPEWDTEDAPYPRA